MYVYLLQHVLRPGYWNAFSVWQNHLLGVFPTKAAAQNRVAAEWANRDPDEYPDHTWDGSWEATYQIDCLDGPEVSCQLWHLDHRTDDGTPGYNLNSASWHVELTCTRTPGAIRIASYLPRELYPPGSQDVFCQFGEHGQGCPDGAVCKHPEPNPNTGASQACEGPNPCNPADGNKYLTDTDYPSAQVPFARHFNSMQGIVVEPTLGVGWSHTYSARLNPVVARGTYPAPGASYVDFVGSDGGYDRFTLTSSNSTEEDRLYLSETGQSMKLFMRLGGPSSRMVDGVPRRDPTSL